MDGIKPAVPRWLDDVAGHHRRQVDVTAQEMLVVARQEDHLSGPEDGAATFLFRLAVPVVCYLIARRGRAEELRPETNAPALAA